MDQQELIQKTVYPQTPKHQYVSIRSFAHDNERKLATQKSLNSWVHMRPNSVLICAMGFHWAPTSWNKLVDMLQYTNNQGTYCGLQEIMDRCLNPYDALGTMRNEAILIALNEGFDWLLYVDNDVQPKPDTLTRLLAWDMPVVAPLVLEPGTGKQLSGPAVQPNTGLHPGKWSVLSMLLINTRVFHAFADPASFWSDAIGADEGFHFQKLWQKGHRVYIDSNTQLVVGGEPTYPLAVNRFSAEERRKFWDAKTEKLNAPPDRRAINPYGPGVTPDGDYMPFVAEGPLPGSASTLLMPVSKVTPITVPWGETAPEVAAQVAQMNGKEEQKIGWGT